MNTCKDCGQPIPYTTEDDCIACAVARHAAQSGSRAASAAHPPPTLREWLGDRVAELGRWAEVLREQPVPAGWITRWEWVMYQGKWHLNAHGRPGTPSGIADHAIVHAALGTTDRQWFQRWYDDALIMGCFARHPDVKPEPKSAAFPWDPYPEVV